MSENMRAAPCSTWFPPDVVRSFIRMREALRRRRYSQVDYLSRKCQKRFPAYAGYYQEQEAIAHKQRGHKEKTLELLRAAHEFFRREAVFICRNLAQELIEQKMTEEARSILAEGVRHFPEDKILQREGIKLLHQQGRIHDALRVLRLYCEDDAECIFWPLRAEYSFEVGLYKESMAAFSQCHEQAPHLDVPWHNAIFFSHYMPEQTGEMLRALIHKWYDAVCASVPPTESVLLRRKTEPDKKLRIGIISSGLKKHPVGWMSAYSLQMLSRIPGYELYYYAVDEVSPNDELRRVFRNSATRWRDAVGWDGLRLYNKLLEDKLDIALEMSGHADGCMLPLFARRVAPIQVKWVGGLYDTTGVPAMDYLLSDRYETPEGCDGEYVEKIVRLPHGYISYMPPVYGVDTDPVLRPDDAPFCFGCFNNVYKLNPVIAGVWADILRRVPGSILLLKAATLEKAEIRARITTMFRDHGIAPERVLCEGGGSHNELLRCYNRVDIALDPWPYTGGLTTLEALYMGVPVVTTPGPSFAGRHAASHLCNVGLHDLVADTFAAYADIAVKLAGDRPLLKKLRYLLPCSLLESPLIRHEQLAADLDTAFRAMWKRYCEGLPPVSMRFEQSSPVPEALKPFLDKKKRG